MCATTKIKVYPQLFLCWYVAQLWTRQVWNRCSNLSVRFYCPFTLIYEVTLSTWHECSAGQTSRMWRSHVFMAQCFLWRICHCVALALNMPLDSIRWIISKVQMRFAVWILKRFLFPRRCFGPWHQLLHTVLYSLCKHLCHPMTPFHFTFKLVHHTRGE